MIIQFFLYFELAPPLLAAYGLRPEGAFVVYLIDLFIALLRESLLKRCVHSISPKIELRTDKL